ncbi:hypothetical protein OEZ85_008930 [Tetradesmus obliquus]|uniref:Uncharacterized protein n=1 Tax=Tetradesmus obliquus TaxID=3088 RepID=A0ABY8TKH0_TETOB|nr:hypothetical protein OEZ85_008930 [Tetradesmus obliquus]
MEKQQLARDMAGYEFSSRLFGQLRKHSKSAEELAALHAQTAELLRKAVSSSQAAKKQKTARAAGQQDPAIAAVRSGITGAKPKKGNITAVPQLVQFVDPFIVSDEAAAADAAQEQSVRLKEAWRLCWTDIIGVLPRLAAEPAPPQESEEGPEATEQSDPHRNRSRQQKLAMDSWVEKNLYCEANYV